MIPPLSFNITLSRCSLFIFNIWIVLYVIVYIIVIIAPTTVVISNLNTPSPFPGPRFFPLTLCTQTGVWLPHTFLVLSSVRCHIYCTLMANNGKIRLISSDDGNRLVQKIGKKYAFVAKHTAFLPLNNNCNINGAWVFPLTRGNIFHSLDNNSWT